MRSMNLEEKTIFQIGFKGGKVSNEFLDRIGGVNVHNLCLFRLLKADFIIGSFESISLIRSGPVGSTFNLEPEGPSSRLIYDTPL